MKNTYKFKCEICGNPMVKAGKNGTGKQRFGTPNAYVGVVSFEPLGNTHKRIH